jgi:hypothetical protein
MRRRTEADMAYLDLTADHPFEASARAPAVDTRLSAQERLVVLLSRTDPLWSLRPRHTHSRALRFLFGIEAPHHLADPKLEALRRYAVTYRLRDASVSEVEEGALQAGFGTSQIAQVRHMVDSARAARPRQSAGGLIRQGLLALAAFLTLYGATAWLSPRLDSPLIAFVFVAVALLSIAPVAAKREPARR